MRQLIAGNWKMNGLQADGRALAEGVRDGALRDGVLRDGAGGLGCDLLLCPPATLLAMVGTVLDGSGVMLGGQDCHLVDQGAHTGDISAPMLADAGAGWVIVGHSERRAEHGENDIVVMHKAQAAAAAGLVPIVCVGETEQHRLSGNAEVVVASQIDGSLPPGFSGVVAYEPVWAIGTGRSATEEDVAAMHRVIREQLLSTLGESGRGVRILYGGSVKPGNAAALLALPEVGGALVGGASLVASEFLAIARAAAH
jgi:triosephosphate isomerase